MGKEACLVTYCLVSVAFLKGIYWFWDRLSSDLISCVIGHQVVNNFLEESKSPAPSAEV